MDKGKYLDSWKEIAAHLGRSIRACQIWERELGLPVHRLDGSPKARVFAYSAELDAWRDEKGAELEISTEPLSKTASDTRRFPFLRMTGLTVIVLIAGFSIGKFLINRKSVSGPLPFESTIKVLPGYRLEGMHRSREPERPSRTAMAVSNDGRFIVYCAIPENPAAGTKAQIFLRRANPTRAVPIAGTEGGINPFLSPDDRWVGFFQDGKLKKIAVGGGVPQTLCEAPLPFGAHWGPGDTIVFSPGERSGLSKVQSDGGGLEILTEPDKTRAEYAHRLPYVLPNGRAVLFTVMRDPYDIHPRLAILDLKTRKWLEIMEDAADGRCLRTGHLVFLREGTLMAVAFDLERNAVKGQPVPVVTDVMQSLNILTSTINAAAGQFSVSDSGSLLYVPGGILPDAEDSLVRVEQDGSIRPVTDFKTSYFAPRFSPDGKRIAYKTYGRESQLWVYDLERSTRTPLTSDGQVGFLTWTPDGKRLAFGWKKSGAASNLFWEPADGSLPMARLTASENNQRPASFTRDGSTLVMTENTSDTWHDILLLDVKSRKVTPFLNSKAAEMHPDLSPDGRWLAYVSDESGRMEVWVRPFSRREGRWQISINGGAEPIWSRDTGQIFYRNAGQVWAVDIQTAGGFSPGRPRLLFENQRLATSNPLRNWDLWPDGQGFLMVENNERKSAPVTEMILVQNWFEELRRLVPTR